MWCSIPPRGKRLVNNLCASGHGKLAIEPQRQKINGFTLSEEDYIFPDMYPINISILPARKMAGVLALVILACLLVVSCRQQDVREVVIKVPGLKNQACAKIIQDAFMRQPGIVSVRPDFQNHEIAVTYNSMVIALKNIEFTVAAAGFDANDTQANSNAVAALPPECR